MGVGAWPNDAGKKPAASASSITGAPAAISAPGASGPTLIVASRPGPVIVASLGPFASASDGTHASRSRAVSVVKTVRVMGASGFSTSWQLHLASP